MIARSGRQHLYARFSVATCFMASESYSRWPVRVALRSCAPNRDCLCTESRGDRRLIQKDQEKHHAYLLCPPSWRCSLHCSIGFCSTCQRARRRIVRHVRDQFEHQVRNACRGRMRNVLPTPEFHCAMLGRTVCRLQRNVHRYRSSLLHDELPSKL